MRLLLLLLGLYLPMMLQGLQAVHRKEVHRYSKAQLLLLLLLLILVLV
jgi:hypothetical protein